MKLMKLIEGIDIDRGGRVERRSNNLERGG